MFPNRITRLAVLAVALSVATVGAYRVARARAAGALPPAPAPQAVTNGVLFTDKQVSQSQASWGDTLFYTITVTNTSVSNPLSILVTDTVPATLVTQPASLWASQGAFTNTAGVLTWSGSLTPTGLLTLGFQATVAAVNTTITNQAVINAGADGIVFSPIAQTAVGLAHVYMPTVARPPAGLFGHITQNGSPAPFVPLLLRFFNGSAWSTAATGSTDGNGDYKFSPSALQAGQSYYVLFTNSSNTSQLYRWGTRVLTAYQPGDSAPMGDCDIADIVMTSPAPGQRVGLPYTFRWSQRSSALTDSYEFDLFDLSAANPFFYTNPPLGYVGAYNLQHLPSGFGTNKNYGWDMWLYSPDGGYGISYYYYYVSFSNTGSAQPETASPRQGRTADLPAALLDPK
jgi:uncharacterized repeat protein (TIGR01451 family)